MHGHNYNICSFVSEYSNALTSTERSINVQPTFLCDEYLADMQGPGLVGVSNRWTGIWNEMVNVNKYS